MVNYYGIYGNPTKLLYKTSVYRESPVFLFTSGISAILLLLFRQNATLVTTNKLLLSRMDRLETLIQSHGIDTAADTEATFRPLESEMEYADFCDKIKAKPFRKAVVSFKPIYFLSSIKICQLKKQGGLTIAEAVSRMLKCLLSIHLQRKFNRTGANGKLQFTQHLEPLIKGKVL